MKLSALILCVAFFAVAQTTIPRGNFDATADQQERAGTLIHLSGHVKVETDGMLLQADTADFNSSSKEIVAHGDVHILLK